MKKKIEDFITENEWENLIYINKHKWEKWDEDNRRFSTRQVLVSMAHLPSRASRVTHREAKDLWELGCEEEGTKVQRIFQRDFGTLAGKTLQKIEQR